MNTENLSGKRVEGEVVHWSRALSVFIFGALFLAGCKGISTKGERAARQDLQNVAVRYRPDNRLPALPKLTAESGLSNYLAYAMLNNPRVVAAYHDWAASVERITVDRSMPDPKLTFQSDIADVVMTVMPGIMQDFPGPGKLKAAARVATAASQTKYFTFEYAVLQTALDLKRACYNLHFLDEKIRIDRETLRLLGGLETIARAQNEVGKATLQDVYRAQIERDKLTTEIASLEDSQRPLLAQFKAALGLTHDQPDPPVPARLETTTANPDSDGLLRLAFARNPRLKAMEAEVRAAQAAIMMAYKEKVPDFSLGIMADLKRSPIMFRPLASVSLPVWRDKIAAEIARARASELAAQARLNAEQIALTVDLAEKSFAYREVNRNLALLQKKLVPKARQSLELARAGYLSGTIDFFNLIDAERMLLTFELGEVEARTRNETLLAEISLLIVGVPPAGAPFLDLPPNSESTLSKPVPDATTTQSTR